MVLPAARTSVRESEASHVISFGVPMVKNARLALASTNVTLL